MNYADLPEGNAVGQRFSQVTNRDGSQIVTGKEQIYRLPPLLLLRRENLYFSNLNVVSSESDNKAIISDPRANELADFVGNTGD